MPGGVNGVRGQGRLQSRSFEGSAAFRTLQQDVCQRGGSERSSPRWWSHFNHTSAHKYIQSHKEEAYFIPRFKQWNPWSSINSLQPFFFFTSIIKSVSCGVFTQELLTSVRVGSPGTGPHISVSGIYLHSEGALCESVPALVIMWTQLRGFTCFDSRWLHTACSCAAGAVMWRRAIGCKPQSASLRGEWLSPTKGSWHVILFLPLPGLSKSLGLIEGFGGRGKGGLPATLSPAEESDAKYLREKYGYNAYLSDRISLDRTIPDHRPGKWVREQIDLVYNVSSEQLQAVKLIFI